VSDVTIAQAWPAVGRPFTVAELDRMPDDGRRYELLDGVLIVSPRPTTIHQVVAGRLCGVLSGACPEDLCVVPEPDPGYRRPLRWDLVGLDRGWRRCTVSPVAGRVSRNIRVDRSRIAL